MEKTLVDILDDLRAEGYTEDFNLKENCLVCGQYQVSHDKFVVDKFMRLEGNSDPDDEVVVYAISAAAPLNLKGVLVNSYGIYADAMASEMMEKLNIRRP